MKFAVIGAGGIGGYLGARLALAGESVTFIARGPNLQALRDQGIRLVEEDGTEHHIGSVKACQQMSEAGEQDVVLLALKAHQVAAVAPQMSSMLGPHTTIVTLQNGIPWWYFHGLPGPWQGQRLESVDPGGVIASHIDNARIIGSVV
ncbi:MAG: oxidoreductase, partial [Betaproteobacteria bacterium]|nr:oxidoreductase [Betaproteobacteria bacterium]